MATGAFRSLGRPGEAKGAGVRVGACERGRGLAHSDATPQQRKILIDRQTRRGLANWSASSVIEKDRFRSGPQKSEAGVGDCWPQNTGHPRRIAETRGRSEQCGCRRRVVQARRERGDAGWSVASRRSFPRAPGANGYESRWRDAFECILALVFWRTGAIHVLGRGRRVKQRAKACEVRTGPVWRVVDVER